MERKIFQINKKIFDFLINFFNNNKRLFRIYNPHIDIFIVYTYIYKTVIVWDKWNKTIMIRQALSVK